MTKASALNYLTMMEEAQVSNKSLRQIHKKLLLSWSNNMVIANGDLPEMLPCMHAKSMIIIIMNEIY
jgi:hypothetical protein